MHCETGNCKYDYEQHTHLDTVPNSLNTFVTWQVPNSHLNAMIRPPFWKKCTAPFAKANVCCEVLWS